jgi:hypothetical protein
MSITILIVLKAKCRGLALIKCLINIKRLYSYPILIKWTALKSVCYFTKSIITCSVSLDFIYLIVLNHLLLDMTKLKDSSNKT